jgi:DNA polymerase-3 subunit alpha
MIRSNSRHAGGLVISENVDSCMPLINNGGVLQTPWCEGQNVRHLEPLGFIKFDILGLETLQMIETAIYHILKRHHGIKKPTFKDIKEFYQKNLHPDVMDFDDQKVYENVFHNGKWAGIFQFTNSGAQNFCSRVKPRNIIDLSAITSIWRPGPMSSDVPDHYTKARDNPMDVKYIHPLARDVTADTFGFLVFQEQIAAMASKLGKDISLEEGNQLRKVLTKKGTGKEDKVKTALYAKFIEGCLEKGISKNLAEQQWQTFEFFSGYGFNKCVLFSELVTIYSQEGIKIEDKQIKDVNVGDYVKSRDEKTHTNIFVKVKANHHNGKKKVYQFTLSSGEKIRCTMDHKFRTKQGQMKTIKEIVEQKLEIVMDR